MDAPVAKLLSELKGGSGVDRWYAARALDGHKEPEVVSALIDALRDPEGRVRRAAEKALIHTEDPRALRPLIERFRDLNSPSEPELEGAIKKLSAGNNDLLAHYLHDPSRSVQWNIAVILATLRDDRPDVLNTLRSGLGNPILLSQAAGLLSDLKDRKSVSTLCYMLNTNYCHNHHDRIAVARALSELGGSAARAALQEAVARERNTDVHKHLAEALHTLGPEPDRPAAGDNQTLQRTEAAGIVSKVRKWFGRGPSR